MGEFVLVIWLARGGFIEKAVEQRHCAEALSIYQASIATGRPLLHVDNSGERVPVLDVRCQRRGPAQTS